MRRAMRIVEAAWLAHPHPDLADAYAHVRLGDSARQRLVRVETLAAKTPGNIEGALAIARAAIDAAEFARAREALAPFIGSADPARGDADGRDRAHRAWRFSGRARAWTLRAVRALHDPAWTADGYVSDRLAAGVAGHGPARCVPVADAGGGLPSDKGPAIESSPFEDAMLAPPAPRPEPIAAENVAETAKPVTDVSVKPRVVPAEPVPPPAAQDNSPPSAPTAAIEPPPPCRSCAAATSGRTAGARAPVSRPKRPRRRQRRQAFRLSSRSSARRMIPASTRTARATNSPNRSARRRRQAGGWRGFWSRWGG